MAEHAIQWITLALIGLSMLIGFLWITRPTRNRETLGGGGQDFGAGWTATDAGDSGPHHHGGGVGHGDV